MSEPSVKPSTDWERIEADYRAGLLSVREIAASNGITHAAVQKRAKRDGWERDLRARIEAKAEALVAKRAVAAEVAAEKAATAQQIVEAGAEAIAAVRLAHRSDIRRGRTLCMSLFEELELQTGNRELFEQLAELMLSPDEKGVDKLNDAYRKAVSFPGRVDSFKKLSDAMKTVVALEREAYGIAPVTQKTEISGDGGVPIALNIVGVRAVSRDEH